MRRTRILSMTFAVVALAALAVLAACTSFGNGDTASNPDAEAGLDGATDAPATPIACGELSPGSGPRPLHPDGSVDTNCGGAMVNLDTSTLNCGACGRNCGLLGCANGLCAQDSLFLTPGGPVSSLYATRGQLVVVTDSAVVAVPLDGGAVRTLAETDAACCVSATAERDSDWVFRASASASSTWQADLVASGGSASNSVTLKDVAVSANVVFITTERDFIHIEGAGADRVIRANRKSDGTGRTLAMAPYAYGLTNANGFLLWSRSPAALPSSGDGEIVRFNPTTQGTERSPALAVGGAVGFDADYAYYFDAVLRELRRLRLDAVKTAPSETLARWTGPETIATSMVTNGEYVYAALALPFATGGVMVRVHRCGGEPVVVARSPALTLGPGPVFFDQRLHYADYRAIYRTSP